MAPPVHLQRWEARRRARHARRQSVAAATTTATAATSSDPAAAAEAAATTRSNTPTSSSASMLSVLPSDLRAGMFSLPSGGGRGPRIVSTKLADDDGDDDTRRPATATGDSHHTNDEDRCCHSQRRRRRRRLALEALIEREGGVYPSTQLEDATVRVSLGHDGAGHPSLRRKPVVDSQGRYFGRGARGRRRQIAHAQRVMSGGAPPTPDRRRTPPPLAVPRTPQLLGPPHGGAGATRSGGGGGGSGGGAQQHRRHPRLVHSSLRDAVGGAPPGRRRSPDAVREPSPTPFPALLWRCRTERKREMTPPRCVCTCGRSCGSWTHCTTKGGGGATITTPWRGLA
jgi:hypothetical protein